jgi:hypothetical protein
LIEKYNLIFKIYDSSQCLINLEPEDQNNEVSENKNFPLIQIKKQKNINKEEDL